MPGSAAEAAPPVRGPVARPDVPARDPAEVRGRLNSFQQGVSRGRRETAAPAEAKTTTATPAEPVAAEAAAPETAPKVAPEVTAEEATVTQPAVTQLPEARPVNPPLPQPRATTRPTPTPRKSSLPQRTAKAVPAAPAPAPAPGETADLGATSEWVFGSDDNWRTVQSVASTAPSTFTPAGLPRRRAGEQLLPGSAGVPAASTGPKAERDPDDVRGRLSSFQQGIRRGRHRTAQSTEANQETLEGE
jgi:hypothetical protein